MKAPDRIVSLDQFRGYTVAAMFIVNFIGGLMVIPRVFKHNTTFFTCADSIMPSCMFAAGFSCRLTMLRRTEQVGAASARRRAIVRSLALILVSLILEGLGE